MTSRFFFSVCFCSGDWTWTWAFTMAPQVHLPDEPSYWLTLPKFLSTAVQQHFCFLHICLSPLSGAELLWQIDIPSWHCSLSCCADWLGLVSKNSGLSQSIEWNISQSRQHARASSDTINTLLVTQPKYSSQELESGQLTNWYSIICGQKWWCRVASWCD